jgi:hypothetical protein
MMNDQEKSENELWSLEEPTLEDSDTRDLNSLSIRSRNSSNPISSFQQNAEMIETEHI